MMHCVPAGYHSHFYKISQLVFRENELHENPPGITGKNKIASRFFQKDEMPSSTVIMF
jgi:hypothetical protein